MEAGRMSKQYAAGRIERLGVGAKEKENEIQAEAEARHATRLYSAHH